MLVPQRCLPGLLIFISACGITVESKQVLDSTSITDQSICPYGGSRVFSGVDDNGNGVLSDDEVDGSTDVCFPAPSAVGSVPPVKVAATATTGATCSQVTLEVGSDTNGDNAFSSAERTGMASVCVPPAESVIAGLAEVTTQSGRITMAENDITALGNRITPIEGWRLPPTDLVVSTTPADGEYGSVPEALRSLDNKVLTGLVQIRIRGGTYVLTEPLVFSHPQGEVVVISPYSESDVVTLQFSGTNGIVFQRRSKIGYFGEMTIEYTGSADTGAVGITVNQLSDVELLYVTVNNFPGAGIRVEGGKVRRTGGFEVWGAGTRNLTVNCPPATVTTRPIGFHVIDDGFADIPSSDAVGCYSGFVAEEGGTAVIDLGVVRTSQQGFVANDGGKLRGYAPSTATINGTQPAPGFGSSFTATNGSSIVLEGMNGWTSDPGATWDFEIRDGSRLRVRDVASTIPLTCGRVECDPTAIIRGCSDFAGTCSATLE